MITENHVSSEKPNHDAHSDSPPNGEEQGGIKEPSKVTIIDHLYIARYGKERWLRWRDKKRQKRKLGSESAPPLRKRFIARAMNYLIKAWKWPGQHRVIVTTIMIIVAIVYAVVFHADHIQQFKERVQASGVALAQTLTHKVKPRPRAKSPHRTFSPQEIRDLEREFGKQVENLNDRTLGTKRDIAGLVSIQDGEELPTVLFSEQTRDFRFLIAGGVRFFRASGALRFERTDMLGWRLPRGDGDPLYEVIAMGQDFITYQAIPTETQGVEERLKNINMQSFPLPIKCPRVESGVVAQYIRIDAYETREEALRGAPQSPGSSRHDYNVYPQSMKTEMWND